MIKRQILIAILLFACSAIAEESVDRFMEDVVYLKNGSIIRGTIIEEIPGKSLTITTRDGNRFTFDLDQVVKIAKESQIPSRQSRPETNRYLGERNKLESWYTYWGLGYANISYPGELDAVMDQLANYPGVDHVAICLDVLGVYFPSKNEQTLLGGIINGFGDRYSAEGEWIQINSVLYSFSIMHFLQHRIGQGPYIRSDVGLARHSIDTNFGVSETSDWGLGILFGGGFAFPITSGTRFALSATYAMRRIEGETTKNLGISLAGLF